MKKRAKGQRIGTRGEDAFRHITSSIGLIATKVGEDFGIDFLCQVERHPNQAVTEVMGIVLGVAVRATTNHRGRIGLSRNDVETLLNCHFPVIIALAHLSTDPFGDSVYMRLIDAEFALKLAEFLSTDAKRVSYTIRDFHTIADAPQLIAQAITPGFAESVRLSLTRHGLSKILPKVQPIEIHRSSEGQLSLVRIGNFLSQFDTSTKEAKDQLHTAVFGSESHLMHRLAQVPLRRGIMTSLNRLPQPVAIGGPITTLDTPLIVEGTSTRCDFTALPSVGHFGFVHASGFSIRISEAKPHEGLMIHEINAVADPDVPVSWGEYSDLWAFLADCAMDGRWKIEGWPGISYRLEVSGDLSRFAFLAYYLRETEKAIEWPPDAWQLSDAKSDEVMDTLALATGILSEPDLLSRFSVVIVDPAEADLVPVSLSVPVCSNLPRKGLILWLDANGKAFMKDGHVAGVTINRVSRVTPEFVDAKFVKSSSNPEMVISPEWATVAFGSKPELTTSDASAWGYETRVTVQPPLSSM